MPKLTDEQRELKDHVYEELAGLPLITVEMSGMQIIGLIGAVQLAMRHPHFPDPAGKMLRGMIGHWAQNMPPAMREFTALGWSTEADVPRDAD